jgi:hypothetical protein
LKNSEEGAAPPESTDNTGEAQKIGECKGCTDLRAKNWNLRKELQALTIAIADIVIV